MIAEAVAVFADVFICVVLTDAMGRARGRQSL
jgi:hypothetical protein